MQNSILQGIFQQNISKRMLTYLSSFLKLNMPWELLIEALKAGNNEFAREVLDVVVSRERGGWE